MGNSARGLESLAHHPAVAKIVAKTNALYFSIVLWKRQTNYGLLLVCDITVTLGVELGGHGESLKFNDGITVQEQLERVRGHLGHERYHQAAVDLHGRYTGWLPVFCPSWKVPLMRSRRLLSLVLKAGGPSLGLMGTRSDEDFQVPRFHIQPATVATCRAWPCHTSAKSIEPAASSNSNPEDSLDKILFQGRKRYSLAHGGQEWARELPTLPRAKRTQD